MPPASAASAEGTGEAVGGAAGEAKAALAALAALDLLPAAAAERARLGIVVERVQRAAPDLAITVDPVENRGFEYHTGISFTFFARGVRGELGRGGRYRTGSDGDEPATGITLYTETVVAAVPTPAPQPRLFVPAGNDPRAAARLRAEGWITVAGLAAVADAGAEARRLGCSHLYEGDKIVAVA